MHTCLKINCLLHSNCTYESKTGKEDSKENRSDINKEFSSPSTSSVYFSLYVKTISKISYM